MTDQTIFADDPVTVTIQIGNSDDLLKQFEWSAFVVALNTICITSLSDVHFFGFSNPEARWQNCCAVLATTHGQLDLLRDALGSLATHFRQFSIAMTVGHTEFVEGGP